MDESGVWGLESRHEETTMPPEPPLDPPLVMHGAEEQTSGKGTGDGTVTNRIMALPGMSVGFVGLAGADKSGPTIRTVAVTPWVFILVEMAWLYLQTFLGLLAIDGMGLADLAPPGDAFSHLWNIGGIALAPTALGLLKESYDYLGKVRASRGR